MSERRTRPRGGAGSICDRAEITKPAEFSDLAGRNKDEEGGSSVDAGERTVPPRLVIVCAVDDHETITLQVPKQTAETLRQQAMAKGVSASTLAATLLKVIEQDGLWDAVLDEEEPSPRRAA